MAVTGKKGVLLVNLGTPDAPSYRAVGKYLKQFLMDRRVIDINPIARNLLVKGIIVPFRSYGSSKLYKQLWTEEGSPLKVYGYQLQEAVQEMLGDDYIVELAMRYQTPSIDDALQRLKEAKVTEILVFPLFPQYSSACVGSVHEEVMRLMRKDWNIPVVKFIGSYYDHPKFIDAFEARGRQYDVKKYDHVIFSYHGLPERQIRKGDDFNHCKFGECCDCVTLENQYCYRAHCFATTRALVERFNLKEGDYTTCFQSRLGRDPWLQPYTSDIVEGLAKEGKKNVLVFCPAFVADCLETTIEIGVEYMEEFEEFGGEHLQLVEGLNAHPLWASAVKDIILEYV
jgi:ferrochelatase